MLGPARTCTWGVRGELLSRVDVGLGLIQQIDHQIVLSFSSADNIHAHPLSISEDPGITRYAVVTLLALWILHSGLGHRLIKKHSMGHTGLHVSSTHLVLLGSEPTQQVVHKYGESHTQKQIGAHQIKCHRHQVQLRLVDYTDKRGARAIDQALGASLGLHDEGLLDVQVGELHKLQQGVLPLPVEYLWARHSALGGQAWVLRSGIEQQKVP